MAKNPFRTARLIYRAIEPTEDEDFVLKLLQDPIAWQQANIFIARPQGKKNVKGHIEWIEGCLLGVVICLPAPVETDKPTPIGLMTLSNINPRMLHCRSSMIGIELIQPHTGKGYGTEAINWILEWAFDTAGLHRVSLGCFEHNPGAKRLYERIGFRLEGTTREEVFVKGRWWDGYSLGMLESEWRERRKGLEEGKGEK